ncbi:LysR family transcriptional regulator [Companilactobacillus bobalius]|uniref:HTH-type transcriptional regulator BlaA n=2 Tax=Companilactobacillus bobalius TaxID=2801451 RepID=A0A202FCZ7_9LACO|nr:LysR family transcriptional regulator [Companilactobacillus bobalius]KAE9561725.1 LysR family transcriptional regulator [Companilactobacillus bobalius]OVE98345.1 HTH-type transcriptional regulator BlaA [Companilactobacillus bobalius]GEO57613.1 LysR family transcriptional regulator [Companilactobacillus paralimentarius]
MPKTDSLNMLRFLDTLLKHGNYTKAAKDLYISQPYLTQTIQNAEKELGIEIINRKSSPLQLTDAGRIYYQYLNSLETEKSNFQRQILKYSSPNKTVIHLGVLSSLGTYLLPLFMKKYLSTHPEVKIELHEDIPETNEKSLLNGEIDFLLGQNPETISPRLTVYNRGTHGYFAIIPKTSQFFQKGKKSLEPNSISIKNLLKEKLVLTTHGSAIRRQVDYLLEKYKVNSNIVLESSNIFTTAKLATSGLGVTLLPESVYIIPNSDEYNIYPLPQSIISLDYFIAYQADRTLNQAEQDLVDSFLNSIQERINQDPTLL